MALSSKQTCLKNSRGKFWWDVECKCKKKLQMAWWMIHATKLLRKIMPVTASKFSKKCSFVSLLLRKYMWENNSFRVHYTEYLCSLVFRNNVDPVSLLDLGELKQVFARANHFMPKQRPGEYEFQYKKRLAQVLISVLTLEIWKVNSCEQDFDAQFCSFFSSFLQKCL